MVDRYYLCKKLKDYARPFEKMTCVNQRKIICKSKLAGRIPTSMEKYLEIGFSTTTKCAPTSPLPPLLGLDKSDFPLSSDKILLKSCSDQQLPVAKLFV